jgi:hypothetical protein
VTVRNGNPAGSSEGGGLRVQGTLNLSHSTVSVNQAGGLYNKGGSVVLAAVDITDNTNGYGLSNLNQASLIFNAGTVSGNQGGGIYNATSTADLSNLDLISNTVGGGLYNTGATLSHITLSNSAVISNTATNGAGLYNDGVGAIADIYNSSLRGNVAEYAGGGISNKGILVVNGSTLYLNHARSGGGIDHSGGDMSLINDTLSGNTASDNGGGIYNRAAATLLNVTLYDNTANGPDTGGNIFNDEASINFKNTLLANSNLEDNCTNSLPGTLISLGHNLESADTCNFHATGDLPNTPPRVGPLQDNGGPTLTHALLGISRAIDHGMDAGCPTTDQRGISRPVDGDGVGQAVCDIGAFEYDGPPLSSGVYIPLIVK